MSRPRALRIVGGSLGVAAAFLLVRRALGLGFDPDSMQLAVTRMGVWAPLAYIGIVTFRVPLGLPSQLVLVGGGVVFGAALGTLYGAIGLLLSAVVLFTFARWTGRQALMPRLPLRLRPVFEVAETRAGALFLAAGTAYPFGPITMYHLIAGITGIPLLVFVVAVGVGSLLRAALFTFFGSRLIAGDWIGVVGAVVGIALVVAVPLLFPRSRRWLLSVLRRPEPPRMALVAARSLGPLPGAVAPDADQPSDSLR